MSRSYRKPWETDGRKGSRRRQFFKRYSNKIIRKMEDVPNGKSYKKTGYTYDICDYKFLCNKGDKWEKIARRK